MGDRKDATRGERLAEFLRRLEAAPAAADAGEAFRQVGDILNAVEDEMTSIPFDPANWQNDGRLYPPQLDSEYPVPGRDDVRRFRTRGHNVLIGAIGAIEIQVLSGRVIFSKPGADGQPI